MRPTGAALKPEVASQPISCPENATAEGILEVDSMLFVAFGNCLKSISLMVATCYEMTFLNLYASSNSLCFFQPTDYVPIHIPHKPTSRSQDAYTLCIHMHPGCGSSVAP